MLNSSAFECCRNNLSNMSASDLVGASDKVLPPVTEVNGGFPLYIFVINIFSCHL